MQPKAWAEWALGACMLLGKKLTFNHILNWLQGELQKSRETGAELHDTLGGSLVSRSAILYISVLVNIIVMLAATKSTVLPVNSPSRSALHNPKSGST